MDETPDTIADDVARRTERLAARLAAADAPVAGATRTVDAEYRDLLDAVRRQDPRFAFDREGRPAAIDAVRAALPAMERDLFDAVIEDHACEIAAIEEAMYQLARACRR